MRQTAHRAAAGYDATPAARRTEPGPGLMHQRSRGLLSPRPAGVASPR